MLTSSFPRKKYLHHQTPIEKMVRLTKHLAGPEIYIKRDDMTGGLTEGGNKVRKLEFIVADALKMKADTLITAGAVQSNHCRATLAAAITEGLKCRLLLEERVPGSYNPAATGNNLLYNLLGAENTRIVPGGTDLMKEMELEKAALAATDKAGYIIPVGASNALGSLGYVSCAEEILEQSTAQEIEFDYLICPSGSGGTHSGLVAGFFISGAGPKVFGINVSRKEEAQKELIKTLVEKILDLLQHKKPFVDQTINCFDAYVGPGYSLPTDQMKEAVKLVASIEGILLDPVYSGKAMAGLIDLIRQNYFRPDEKILFLHTGGVPALYAYAGIFQ